ncbi:MAG: class I SAM-dependent methyltransferase [Bdellovibrionaceae bacterium]|nr:class I SAM-dependent methyltransferase [Pseudobdellovibrionaceae bacterium]
MSAIRNRLDKNNKKLSPWAARLPTEAWRLYDRDIPEYPFIVDIYLDHAVVWDRSDSVIDREKNHLPELLSAIQEVRGISPEKIVIKKRERQEGVKQYERIDEKQEFFTVREGKAKLKVNLHDYLDTGLFLDHRPMRYQIQRLSKGRKVLNLFCYTGSVSVFAALGGGQVTSVDMSATYLDWAKDNFALNQIDPAQHEFIQSDVLQWIPDAPAASYDLIFLDPPTFSNSKRMNGTFEVERDQETLVEACMRLLLPGGVLYFSNNKRGFRLSPNLSSRYEIKDISDETIPQDFHDKKIHRCFEIRAPRP